MSATLHETSLSTVHSSDSTSHDGHDHETEYFFSDRSTRDLQETLVHEGVAAACRLATIQERQRSYSASFQLRVTTLLHETLPKLSDLPSPSDASSHVDLISLYSKFFHGLLFGVLQKDECISHEVTQQHEKEKRQTAMLVAPVYATAADQFQFRAMLFRTLVSQMMTTTTNSSQSHQGAAGTSNYFGRIQAGALLGALFKKRVLIPTTPALCKAECDDVSIFDSVLKEVILKLLATKTAEHDAVLVRALVAAIRQFASPFGFTCSGAEAVRNFSSKLLAGKNVEAAAGAPTKEWSTAIETLIATLSPKVPSQRPAFPNHSLTWDSKIQQAQPWEPSSPDFSSISAAAKLSWGTPAKLSTQQQYVRHNDPMLPSSHLPKQVRSSLLPLALPWEPQSSKISGGPSLHKPSLSPNPFQSVAGLRRTAEDPQPTLRPMLPPPAPFQHTVAPFPQNIPPVVTVGSDNTLQWIENARRRTVYLSRLPPLLTQYALMQALSRFGQVTKVRLCDGVKFPTYYGFVEFAKITDAEAIVQSGRFHVVYTAPEDEHSSSGITQIRCRLANTHIQDTTAIDAAMAPNGTCLKACLFGMHSSNRMMTLKETVEESLFQKQEMIQAFQEQNKSRANITTANTSQRSSNADTPLAVPPVAQPTRHRNEEENEVPVVLTSKKHAATEEDDDEHLALAENQSVNTSAGAPIAS